MLEYEISNERLTKMERRSNFIHRHSLMLNRYNVNHQDGLYHCHVFVVHVLLSLSSEKFRNDNSRVHMMSAYPHVIEC